MMDPLLAMSIGVVIASPILGRLTGALIARERILPAKRSSALMPEPPSLDVAKEADGKPGDAAERYDKNVDRATRALRRHLLESEGEGQTAPSVTADSVALALVIHPDVAAAALERLRGRVPCRLRVTRAGQVIHRFDLEALASEGRTSIAGTFGRGVLVVASIIANLGAAWPLLFSLFIATLALAGLNDDTNSHALLVAVGVVLIVPLSFLFVLGGGVLVGAVLTPLGSTPKLGNALPGIEAPKEAEAAGTPSPKEGKRKKERREQRRRKEDAASSGRWQTLVTETDGFGLSGVAKTVALSIAAVGLPVLLLVILAQVFHVTVGWLLLAVCGVALAILFVTVLVMTEDGEAAVWITPLVVLGLLLAIALLAFVGVVVWLIGLFSSIFRDRLGAIAPGDWVQRRHKADDLSELVPTNDLVVRLYAALSKHLRLARPVDPTMTVRLATLADEGKKRLSALEIALSEGLDLPAAVSLGARLSAHAGGEIHVSDEGDLDFSLPVSSVPEPRPLAAEAVERNAGEYVAPKGLPVNIPGITLGDIEGAERLTAGSTLVFLTLLGVHSGWLTTSFPGFTWQPHVFLWPASAALVLGSFTLTGVARYVARAEVRAGALRDVRRLTVRRIAADLDGNEKTFDARDLSADLERALHAAWPTLTEGEILEAVVAVCDGLGLELSSDAMVNDRDARAFLLAPLRARRESIAALRRGGAALRDALNAEDDEIVFDTGEPALLSTR